MNNIIKNKKLWKTVLIVYILFLLFLIVFKLCRGNIFSTINHIISNRSLGYWNFNFIPFKTIKDMIKYNNYINILANILPFLLLGFLISITSENFKIIRLVLKCFGIILCFEILQFITCLGFFDIDDILFNTISCFLGIVLYFVFINIFYIKSNS